MEDLDKDGDGALSLEEYLGEPGTDPDTGEPPEWVKSETETFKTVRDSNGNGKMDRVWTHRHMVYATDFSCCTE